VIHDGVANLGAIDVPVEMKEQSNLTLRPLVDDAHPPDQDIPTEVDGVVEGEREREIRVPERHVRDQRVRQVHEVPRPAMVVEPGEPSVHPEAKPVELAAGGALLTAPSVIDVAQLVLAIEIDP